MSLKQSVIMTRIGFLLMIGHFAFKRTNLRNGIVAGIIIQVDTLMF